MITVKDFQKATEFPSACKDSVGSLRVGAAVGTAPDTLQRVAALREAGVDVVVVDTSHGHSRGVLETVARIKAKYPDIQVIGGNIVTAEAALDLVKHGRRRGQGGHRTGIDLHDACHSGRRRAANQWRSLGWRRHWRARECRSSAHGGIRYSGDIAKGPGGGSALRDDRRDVSRARRNLRADVELYQGGSYKAYRGMGSFGRDGPGPWLQRPLLPRHQTELEKLVAGGIEGRVPYKAVSSRFCTAVGGSARRHGIAAGSGSIEEMRTRPQFVRITSAGRSREPRSDVTITKEAPNYRIGDAGHSRGPSPHLDFGASTHN